MREKMTKKEIRDYRNNFAKLKYDDLRVQCPKDDRLPARIAAAVAAGKAKSKQAYIIDAIKTRLDVDQIPMPGPTDD